MPSIHSSQTTPQIQPLQPSVSAPVIPQEQSKPPSDSQSFQKARQSQGDAGSGVLNPSVSGQELSQGIQTSTGTQLQGQAQELLSSEAVSQEFGSSQTQATSQPKLPQELLDSISSSSPKLKAGGSNHVDFLYSLQLNNLCSDWLPFKQSNYIQETLHGDLPVRTRHAAGVCNELSLVGLQHWNANGTSSDILALFEKSSVAERISDLADRHVTLAPTNTDKDFFLNAMASHGLPAQQEHNCNSAAGAADILIGKGQCAVMFHGRGQDATGHTILADGNNFAIFDPNVGYMKMQNEADFKTVFKQLVDKFYPEFRNLQTLHSIDVIQF